MLSLCKIARAPVTMATWSRMLHQTSVNWAGGKWRQKQGHAPCGNEYGPLVEIPDWSHADGRPKPISFKENSRREKNKAIGERAVRLMGQLRAAKQNHKNKQKILQEEPLRLKQHQLRAKNIPHSSR